MDIKLSQKALSQVKAYHILPVHIPIDPMNS